MSEPNTQILRKGNVKNMAKINVNGLTEKGIVKTQVRESIAKRETNAFDMNSLKNYDRVENKNVFVKEYETENGSIYATWTLTISNKHPLELAPKKRTNKKVEKETYEIEG